MPVKLLVVPAACGFVVEQRIAWPISPQSTLGPKTKKSKSIAKSVFVDPSAKVGVSIKPNLPPVFIFILNHKLLFSSLPHVFEPLNYCTPTPVAFKS